jgi:protein TonB
MSIGRLAVVLVALTSAGCAARIYTPGGDVSQPVLLNNVRPYYSQAALAQQIEGHVLLDLVVRESGEVDDVRVVRSLDATHGLDAEAVRVARQWRFRPSQRDGRAVAVRVPADIEFTLK